MKTIEEKAKAYDEIIERAKTMLSAGEVMYGKENNASQLITDIIPELRESEDERIRKELIDIIKRSYEIGGFTLNNKKLRDKYIAYLERQKEQKSAEWSDKDKNIFNLALNLIKHSDDCDGILDKDLAVKWFAELPSRFVPQPKQEWSDGNKQWFDAIIKDYEDLLSGDEDHDPAIQIKINLLKSLRPQPHWKPSKEQMEAFEESLMSVAYTENKIILESLLEQLKKLCQ